MQRLKAIIQLFIQALRLLLRNDPLRMAGATAFFSTFALPGILIVIVQAFAHIVGPRTIRQGLGSSLSATFGQEQREQIVNAIRSIRSLASTWYVAIFGFIFLLFVVTTLFKIVKGSVNQLWRIRVVGTERFIYGLISRLRAMLIVLFAGVLVVIGIGTEILQAMISRRIITISTSAGAWFNITVGYILSIAIIACWLAGVFRYLAEGRPTWRVAWVGALLTAILFTIGRTILNILLTYGNVNTIYGASASVIVLLLFVFYISLIFYYGAAFTTVYANHVHHPIIPVPHAARYKVSAKEDE